MAQLLFCIVGIFVTLPVVQFPHQLCRSIPQDQGNRLCFPVLQVSPNAIKVLLPQGAEQTSAKPMARVIIDKNLNYYGAFGKEDEMPLAIDEVAAFLQECAQKEPEMYVALYADESIPYREIVRVLNIANENHFKMVLATRRPDKN